MIQTEEQLIECANLIENETDRLSFIMHYLLEYVQYDYGYLLIGGFLHDNLKRLQADKNHNLSLFIEENPFSRGTVELLIDGESKEYDDFYCCTYRVAEGKSELLDKVNELIKVSNGDMDSYLSSVYNLFSEELRKHLNNDDLINSEISSLMTNINKQMHLGYITGSHIIFNSIQHVLLKYLIKLNIYFPPIFENGLIKKGVCQHYADYLEQLLPKVGISAIRIDGTSEYGHAWVAAIVDGKLKSIDLTRAIFIRDGYKGISTDQKSSDWLISDFKRSFEMQPTRTITGIGASAERDSANSRTSLSLPFIINKDNYDEKVFMNLVVKQIEKCKRK